MNVLGIDPGLRGGLAVLDDQAALLYATAIPLKYSGGKPRIDWSGLFHKFKAIKARAPEIRAVLETQMPFAQLDERGHPRVMGGTATMIENYGRLKLCLEWTGIEYIEIFPQSWQAEYRARGARRAGGKDALATTSDRNKANNEHHMRVANALFPDAAGAFGKAWGPGTATAALIGRHWLERLKRERMEAQAHGTG